MIVGIGVDLVNVPRFAATLNSVAGLKRLYFCPAELVQADGEPRSAGSLAARYAAKEAVSKALGHPAGLRHIDCEILRSGSGEPELVAKGSVASAAAAAGVSRWHVSLSQEGDVAMAMVIAERDDAPRADPPRADPPRAVAGVEEVR